MKRIGLTGGIGCGKTTVVDTFRLLGVPCFVADAVAAGYYGQPAFLKGIRDLFGDVVFFPDGTADKRRIADIVFRNQAALDSLNSLVHPKVIADFDAFCHAHGDFPYVLFESAILYEHHLESLMDGVVCVYLDLPERLRRLRLRDRTPDASLLARIAAQMPAEEAMLRADYVILNYEGNPRQRQVEYIDRQLRQ